MRTFPIVLAALLAAAPAPVLAQASAAIASGKAQPSPLSPGEIVAAAPKAEWVSIAPADLLVMDLAPDAKGKPRRVVIQLMPPPFSQGWIGNISKLAKAHWWDGLSVNRVQDNYVAQWGDADGEDKAKARALPAGLAVVPESQYVAAEDAKLADQMTAAVTEMAKIALLSACILQNQPDEKSQKACGAITVTPPIGDRDSYAPHTGHFGGWPIATDFVAAWPVHCYGMVGVGRDLSPNTGSGAELYTVIGHAPRHLDRNIALVGRVIEGIEHLSSLPRGTGTLGFYETPEERTKIVSIRLVSEMEADPGLRFEYLSTESETFARYADARANRRDPFFIRPAGGADICNIPAPVRRVK